MPVSAESKVSEMMVAVRSSDGMIFHWSDYMPHDERTQIKRVASGRAEDKWQFIVRGMMRQGRPCVVKLIVGFDSHGSPFATASGFDT